MGSKDKCGESMDKCFVFSPATRAFYGIASRRLSAATARESRKGIQPSTYLGCSLVGDFQICPTSWKLQSFITTIWKTRIRVRTSKNYSTGGSSFLS